MNSPHRVAHFPGQGLPSNITVETAGTGSSSSGGIRACRQCLRDVRPERLAPCRIDTETLRLIPGPDSLPPASDQQAFEMGQTTAECIREAFFALARALLQGNPTCPETPDLARSFLARQGFDLQRLGQLPVGFFAHPALMAKELVRAGFCPEEIKDSKLVADRRLTGRLAGPIRDVRGRIVSFWARHPQFRKPEYLYLDGSWRKRAVAYGLDVALPCVLDGSESLLVIQDLLDAMLLQSKGFFHVAAVGKGGRGLATRRWEQLADLGIREVTLALDHDPRHGDDTLCALENAFRAGRAPAVFVVPPGAWPGPWGARGLLCREGLAALRSFLEKERMPGGQYAPRQVPSNNPAFAADESLTEEEPERSPEPEPLASEAREKPSRQQGFCPFHQCSETTCFCFD